MKGDQATILQEKIGSVLVLRLNRPAERNAMSAELVDRLITILGDLDHHPETGAVVLAGAGKGFCAGSDLGGLARMTSADRARFETDSGRAARMLAHVSKPVIAAVHGFAIGGGLTLATSCDIVVTEDACRWSLPEVPIGLFPAWGIGSVIQRVGLSKAKRLCWGIDTLSGREAAAQGLADMVADDAVGVALATADRLCALPRAQAMAVKRYFASHAPDEAFDVAANQTFLETTLTREAGESFVKYGKLDQ